MYYGVFVRLFDNLQGWVSDQWASCSLSFLTLYLFFLLLTVISKRKGKEKKSFKCTNKSLDSLVCCSALQGEEIYFFFCMFSIWREAGPRMLKSTQPTAGARMSGRAMRRPSRATCDTASVAAMADGAAISAATGAAATTGAEGARRWVACARTARRTTRVGIGLLTIIAILLLKGCVWKKRS